MTGRAPLPPGFVRMIDLCGVKPVRLDQALDNRARLMHPMRSRRGRPGLVPFDAPALWRAIRAGVFPAPTVGAFGIAWPLETIERWRRRAAPNDDATAALTDGGIRKKLQGSSE